MALFNCGFRNTGENVASSADIEMFVLRVCLWFEVTGWTSFMSQTQAWRDAL